MARAWRGSEGAGVAGGAELEPAAGGGAATSSSRGSEFLDARDLVQVKYEMVRRARVDGEPVGGRRRRSGSRARRSMRRSRRSTRAGWRGWCRRGRGRGGRTS